MPTKYSYAPQDFHILILPTERCNFRCLYCYESHEGESMNREVEQNLINLLYRQIAIREKIWVSWFGGEPLLRKELLLRVSRAIQNKINENPAVTYAAGITTNGYLLDESTFLELLSVGVNDFQITLDGPKVLHDTMRPLAGGGGTHDVIMSNIRFAQSTTENFKILLRVHYTPENVDDILAYKNELVATFGGDERFSFFFRPVGRLGGENDSCIALFSPDELAEVRAKFVDLPKNQLFEETAESICYAARPNSFAVRPNGELVKCTVALDDPRNHVGCITKDGELSIDEKQMWPWISGFLNGDIIQRRCPLANMATASDKDL
ncbi:radical SAM protein [Halodesulfovibrio aestuarii]|uniref:radical SAM protein n=1 Tax=Halodesulfovibrio aestuarii TaxID=126333 RepID=UPI00042A536B